MGIETKGLVAGVNGNTDWSILRYGCYKSTNVSCWHIEELRELGTTRALIDRAQAILCVYVCVCV